MSPARRDPEPARQKLASYLRQIRTIDRDTSRRSRLLRAARTAVPASAVLGGKLLLTSSLAPVSRKKLARLVATSDPVKLQLGCGPHHVDGWVNIDLVGSAADCYWNLRRPIPLPAGSVGAIFHEHLLEHFPLAEGLALTRECHRLLRPAGTLRIGVPDFGSYIRSYCGDGAYIEANRPGRPTRLLALAEVAYRHNHRSIWDADTLLRLLQEAGFPRATVREHGDSALDPAPDAPDRKGETLYVEAVR